MVRPTIKRVLVALACATLASCGATKPSGAPTVGRTFVDDLGRTVTVSERPSRIVSLAPNLTEIVFAVGAGDRLIADTSFCDFPPEAVTKTHIGDTQRPDLERLIALKPDLVLVSTSSQLESIFERLAELRIPTFVSNPRDLDGVIASAERVGDLVGEARAGASLAEGLRARAKNVAARVAGLAPPKVFVVVGEDPLITSGQGTFVDDLVRRAGGDSISGDQRVEWPQFSAETVVARAPDVIVFPGDAHGVPTVPSSLSATPAVRTGRIVRIDGDLMTRPGPRLVDGLEQLAAELHPEAFR